MLSVATTFRFSWVNRSGNARNEPSALPSCALSRVVCVSAAVFGFEMAGRLMSTPDLCQVGSRDCHDSNDMRVGCADASKQRTVGQLRYLTAGEHNLK